MLIPVSNLTKIELSEFLNNELNKHSYLTFCLALLFVVFSLFFSSLKSVPANRQIHRFYSVKAIAQSLYPLLTLARKRFDTEIFLANKFTMYCFTAFHGMTNDLFIQTTWQIP